MTFLELSRHGKNEEDFVENAENFITHAQFQWIVVTGTVLWWITSRIQFHCYLNTLYVDIEENLGQAFFSLLTTNKWFEEFLPMNPNFRVSRFRVRGIPIKCKSEERKQTRAQWCSKFRNQVAYFDGTYVKRICIDPIIPLAYMPTFLIFSALLFFRFCLAPFPFPLILFTISPPLGRFLPPFEWMNEFNGTCLAWLKLAKRQKYMR